MRRQSFVDGCRFSYEPPTDVREPRRCISHIATCPPDADAQRVLRCFRPDGVAYVYKSNGPTYRNRDCAVCNGVSDYDLSCNSTLTLRSRHVGSFESFSIILDLNTGKGSTVGEATGGSATQRLGSCPELHVYDPFAGTCRAIACPPGQSFTEDGLCQPDPENVGDVTSRRQSIVRYNMPVFNLQQTTRPPDSDCAWIQIWPSEYRPLTNGSIFVPLHHSTYDTSAYHLDENLTAYVCTPFQRNYTELVPEALRVDAIGTYLSAVCSVISLVALAFQFAVYMAFPVLRNTPGRCIICLVVSLFVGQLLFLLVKTGSSVSPGFCIGQAATLHYAFLAAFFWMNVMAVDIYRAFSASPGAAASSSSPFGARRRFAGYSAYAWLTAAAVVGVAVALDLSGVGGQYRPHYGHRVCWFGSRGGLLVLFGAPVGVLLTANIILFALSVRQIRSASRASEMAVQKTDQTQLLVRYFILLCRLLNDLERAIDALKY